MKMSRAPSASDNTCERRQCQRLSLCRRSAASCMTGSHRCVQRLTVLKRVTTSFGKWTL